MKHITVEQIDPPYLGTMLGAQLYAGEVSYRASTQVDLQTDMGEQSLYLGANGKTRESAIAHLERLVDRTPKAMALITELPKSKKKAA